MDHRGSGFGAYLPPTLGEGRQALAAAELHAVRQVGSQESDHQGVMTDWWRPQYSEGGGLDDHPALLRVLSPTSGAVRSAFVPPGVRP